MYVSISIFEIFFHQLLWLLLVVLKFEQATTLLFRFPSWGHASKKLKTLSEASSNYVIWVDE
jgi:hypothetical protein